MALMDKDAIGIYVAEIIADPRTITKVFIYSEVLTSNRVCAAVGEVNAEEPDKKYVTKKELLRNIADAKKLLEKDPADMVGFVGTAINEYAYLYAIRGDNTPDAAKHLGYLDAHEVYPDLKTKPLKEYFQVLVDNKPEGATKMNFAFMLNHIANFQ